MSSVPNNLRINPNALPVDTVQDDHMRWAMLRTRRRAHTQTRGLDAAANRWLARLRHAPRGLRYLRQEAQAVAALENQWSDLSDAAMDERITELRGVFARQRQQREHLRQGLAAVREVARRTRGEFPYVVQLMGALGLYHGQIVEMVTGEGKTLTAAVAATLLGWCGKPVHVYTVNDYLAERDAAGRMPIYERCGLASAALLGDMKPDERAQVYRQPIVYTTAKEVMADWLRDQLALGRQISPVATRWRQSAAWSNPHNAARQAPPTRTLVPGLFVALVDEIDAILIDEAITPLIIAQRDEQNGQEALYRTACQWAQSLEAPRHYHVLHDQRRCELTSAGKTAIRQKFEQSPDEIDDPIWQAARLRNEMVEQALTAIHCYQHGRHYEVVEEEVWIVDEYTGRFMADRHWQNGLHQMVEAKHDLPITGDQRVLASISFQRFFRQYRHLCGMTGTAAEARPEMERTYGLPVRVIPTHRPIQRKQWPTCIYRQPETRWEAVVDEVAQVHAQGRPILIGTRSVEASQHLSQLLTTRDLTHRVLNAVEHEQEAHIIEAAGRPAAITVATNMAGRGTDIKLAEGVAGLGGLHVILTEMHDAKRVDRQFVGRAGRQGDPGSARFYASLADDLAVKWMPATARHSLRLLPSHGETPLPTWVQKLFGMAQHRATRHAAKMRVMAIEHDQEMDRSLPV